MKSGALAAKVLLFAAAASLGIWTADVLVHLAFVEDAVNGSLPPSRPSDFAGLLLADAPVAGAATAAALVAAWGLAALGRRADGWREALACGAAALAAIACVAGLEIHWSGRIPAWTLLAVASTVGVGVWLLERGRAVRDGGQLAALIDRALLPCVTVAFGVRAASGLRAGEPTPTLLAAILFGATGAVWLGLRWGRPAGALAWPLRAAPLLAALLLALLSTRAWEPGLEPWPRADGSPGARDRPGIALIVLDTVRADRLPLYGYPRPTMPELERWARQGVVAKRAVSAAGWTTPSHASMFSGQPVSLHGLHSSATTPSLHTRAVAGVPWLPRRLSEAGYHTLGITANPLAITEDMEGFDRVLSPERSQWHRSSVGAMAARLFPWQAAAGERLRWRLPYVDAAQLVGIVERTPFPEPGPTFLFVNFFDAHSPYNPPAPALAALGELPPRSFDRYLTHRQLTRALPSLGAAATDTLHRLYDAELRWIDLHLPRLFSLIEERLGGDAVVIVTADHGEELGESGRVGHEFGLAQALLHVPLVVRAPWLEPGETDLLISTRSLARFISAVAAGGEPGIDILAARDPYGVIAERYPSRVNVETLGEGYDRAWVALFAGDTKVVGPSRYGTAGFDLQRFGEDRAADVDAALRARVDAYWEASRDRREPAPEPAALSQDAQERLRALGYAD